MVAPVAYKDFAVVSGSSVTASYTKISDGTAYTPGAGDGIVIILSGTKNTAGASSIPLPGTFIEGAGKSTDVGSINCTAQMLTKVADGNSSDSPVISGLTTAAWKMRTYVYASGTFEPSQFPFDPASLPQNGSGSTATAANTGVAFTTRAPNVTILSALCLRGPATLSSAVVTWGGGTAADHAITGSSNSFMATGTQTPAAAGTQTPSATWTSGGGGTASNLLSIGIAPPGSSAGEVEWVCQGGVWVPAIEKVSQGGAWVTATPHVSQGGVWE